MSPVIVAEWRGFRVTVDPDDAIVAQRYKWSVSLQNGKPYAKAWISSKLIYLHRWLVDAGPDQIVDHIDGDTLNCRRSNLRLTDRTGNARNRSKDRANRSGFKGVTVRRIGFEARILSKSLGKFPTPEAAAHAYDAAARQQFGEFARTNFPNPTTNPAKESHA